VCWLPSQCLGVGAETTAVCATVVLGSSDLFDSPVVMGQLVVGKGIGFRVFGPSMFVHCLGDVFSSLQELVFPSDG